MIDNLDSWINLFLGSEIDSATSHLWHVIRMKILGKSKNQVYGYPTCAHGVFFREALSILFSPKLVTNFKPAKFETFRTEPDFRPKNSLRQNMLAINYFPLLGLAKFLKPKTETGCGLKNASQSQKKSTIANPNFQSLLLLQKLQL